MAMLHQRGRPSLEMGGEVLVHLEHGYLILAENIAESIVSQNFSAVLRILQVVRANVLPHLAHYLAPSKWARARRVAEEATTQAVKARLLDDAGHYDELVAKADP